MDNRIQNQSQTFKSKDVVRISENSTLTWACGQETRIESVRSSIYRNNVGEYTEDRYTVSLRHPHGVTVNREVSGSELEAC
jgi:hypothetical protein